MGTSGTILVRMEGFLREKKLDTCHVVPNLKFYFDMLHFNGAGPRKMLTVTLNKQKIIVKLLELVLKAKIEEKFKIVLIFPLSSQKPICPFRRSTKIV